MFTFIVSISGNAWERSMKAGERRRRIILEIILCEVLNDEETGTPGVDIHEEINLAF